MNFKHVWIIFMKEVKGIMRDRKTLIMSVALPLIFIPVINILIGGGVENLKKDISQNVTVGLSENSRTEDIKAFVKDEIINGNTSIRLIDIENTTEAVRQEKVRVVLDIERDYKEKIKASKPVIFKLFYDRTKDKSSATLPIIQSVIDKFNKKVVSERLSALNINVDIFKPIIIEETDVADNKKAGNAVLSMILPLMIVIFIASGGIPAATELIAGEKERGTLEPLLTTKVKRLSILMGKYLTVTLFSLLTVAATFGGFVISYLIKPGSLSMGISSDVSGFYVPPLALLLTLAISMTLGLIFTGLQIALSTYAKSFREAQTYLGFLSIVVIIPAYSVMFMQANDAPLYMFFTPIISTIVSLKMVLGGTIVYSSLLLALGSSLLYAGLAIVLSSWMFTKEKILFRS